MRREIFLELSPDTCGDFRFQHEMDQARKKLSDAEMEHTKAVNKVGLRHLCPRHDVEPSVTAQSRSHGSGTAS